MLLSGTHARIANTPLRAEAEAPDRVPYVSFRLINCHFSRCRQVVPEALDSIFPASTGRYFIIVNGQLKLMELERPKEQKYLRGG